MWHTTPVVAVCGYSGCGKTTAIERAVRILTGRGARVGVVKHDAHRLDIDRSGKDSDRFFQAGADVLVHDPTQICIRRHVGRSPALESLLEQLAETCDVILVEGHKRTNLPVKIWLLGEGKDAPPAEFGPWTAVLARDTDRAAAILDAVETVRKNLPLPPLWAGILIGGQSSRMGHPKHLLPHGSRSWLQHIVETVEPTARGIALLGTARLPDGLGQPDRPLPVIPDCPGRKGPLAGILAAMRWNPEAAWLVLSCDLPQIRCRAVQWLAQQRVPGQLAIVPVLGSQRQPEPLFAIYEPAVRMRLETCQAPKQIIGSPGIATVPPPTDLQPAWLNVNTPGQLERWGRRRKDHGN